MEQNSSPPNEATDRAPASVASSASRPMPQPCRNPRDHAPVLCVVEKSQCQALKRSHRPLPLADGRPERAAHDYFQHGTTSLSATLIVQTGKVIGTEAIRRCSFHSVPHLSQTILDCVTANNRHKPFIWTVFAELIVGKVAHLSSEPV
jgi:hypothetical protein